MYQGKRILYNKDAYESHRKDMIRYKQDATWVAFAELEGLLSKAQIARQYFNKSQGWFSQKLNGCTIGKKEKSFSDAEYTQLADAFRDIAHRLEAHAAEIDAAKSDA